MHNIRSYCVAIGVAIATLAVPLTATPASAISGSDCETLSGGAYGYWSGDWSNANTLNPLGLYLWDTKADGHHVQIRLRTRTNSNSVHLWPWHYLYAGNGSATEIDTSAYDSNGISAANVEVAVYEGSSEIESCSGILQYRP